MSVDVVGAVLAVMYSFVLSLGVNQIYRLMNSKNNKLSLRTGILFILTLGPVIRVAFWCKVASQTDWSNQLRTAMFFVPVCILLIGYSLLVVFYAATLFDTRSRRPLQYAVVINTVFLVLCMTMAVLIKDPDSSEKTKKYLETVFLSLKACLDITVAGLLCYFGHRFGVMQTSHKTVSTRILPRSPKLFSYVNWVLVLSSVARGVFNICMILVIGPHDRLRIHFGDSSKNTPLFYAFFFFVSEMVPAVCIFITLWKRPSTNPKAKTTSSPTSAAERAVAYSIDEQNAVVVRHFGNGNDSAHPAASTWWSSSVANATRPESGTFRGSGEPFINEASSDDEYMMFSGVVHPGSAIGDAVQIPNITRNQLLFSASPDYGNTRDCSQIMTAAPYASNPSGLPPIVPHMFGQGGVSPVVSGTGTPPGFDNWMKMQRGPSDPSLSSLARSSKHSDTQGGCNSRSSSIHETDACFSDVGHGDGLENNWTDRSNYNSSPRGVRPVPPFAAPPSGLLSLQLSQKLNARNIHNSQLTAGIPPSFNAWTKMQRGSSDPALSSLATGTSCSGGKSDAPGSCNKKASTTHSDQSVVDWVDHSNNSSPRGVPPVSPFAAHRAGLLTYLDLGTGSPVSAGVPPSFDAWTKIQQASSETSLSSLANAPSCSSAHSHSKGNGTTTSSTRFDVGTDLSSVAGVPPSLNAWMHPDNSLSDAAINVANTVLVPSSTTSCSNSRTHSDSGISFGWWGHPEVDMRVPGHLRVTVCHDSAGNSAELQVDQSDQDGDGNMFEDYLSPRDILMAQQKKSMK